MASQRLLLFFPRPANEESREQVGFAEAVFRQPRKSFGPRDVDANRRRQPHTGIRHFSNRNQQASSKEFQR